MRSIYELKEILKKCEIDWMYHELSPHDLLVSEIINDLKLRIKWKNKTQKCKAFVNITSIEKNSEVFTVNITASNMTSFPHIMYTSVGRLIMMISLIDEYLEYFRNIGWVKKIKYFPCKTQKYIYKIGPSDTPYSFYWYYLKSGEWCLKIPCQSNSYIVIPERVKYLSCLEPFAYLGLKGLIPGIKPAKLLKYKLESFATIYKLNNVEELFLKIQEHINGIPCDFPIINQKDGYVKFIQLDGKLNLLFDLYTFCASYLESPILLKNNSKVYVQSSSELVIRLVLEGILNGSLFNKKGSFLCGSPRFNCAFFSLSA